MKGKTNEDVLATRNKFESLEVEEIEHPTWIITDGKRNGDVKKKEKQHLEKEAKKVQEKR